MTTFRPINLDTDAADIARLYNSTVNETLSIEGILDWWTPRAGEIRITILAQDKTGAAIGYWDIDHEAWMTAGTFKMKVVVAPEMRGHGLGTQMYCEASRLARERGATHFESYIRETDAVSIKFAEARGLRSNITVLNPFLILRTSMNIASMIW